MDIQLQLNNSVGVLCSAMLFLLAIEVYTNCLTARRVKREWVLVGLGLGWLCYMGACCLNALSGLLIPHGSFGMARIIAGGYVVAGTLWIRNRQGTAGKQELSLSLCLLMWLPYLLFLALHSLRS